MRFRRLFVLLLLGFQIAPLVQAQTYSVTTNSGGTGAGSLGAAFAAFEATAPGSTGTVNFSALFNTPQQINITASNEYLMGPTGNVLTLTPTAGLLTLNGTGTSSNIFNLDSGTLNLGNMFIENGSIITSNQTLGLSNVTINSDVWFQLYGPTTITTGAGTNNVINASVFSPVATPVALTVSGAGTLVLTNTGDSWTGGTNINGGVLSISDPAVLGTGGLSFNGGTLLTTTSLTESQAIALSGSGGTLSASSGTVGTYSGKVTGTGGLSVTGAGTVALTNTTNSFTGNDTVASGGTLSVGAGGDLGSGSNSVILNGGTLQLTGSSTFSDTLNLAGSGATVNVTSGHTATWNGLVTGSAGLNVTGAGVLALGDTSNNFTGGVTVASGGTLSIGNDTELGNAANGVVLNGGTLAFTNFISTSRTLTLNGGGGTLSGGAVALTWNGLVTGSGGLAVSGGDVVLTDTSNNYSGGTSLIGGDLTYTADSQLGSGGIYSNGGQLVLSSGSFTSAKAITLGGSGLEFNTSSGTYTFSGNISGTGAINDFFGTAVLTGNNTYSGGTNVDSTLGVGSNTALGTGGLLLYNGTLFSTAAVTLANGLSLFSGSTDTISGSNNLIISGGLSSGSNITTLNITNTGTTGLNGNITGSGGVNFNSTGTLLVGGNNSSWLGEFAVSGGGTIIIGNNNALGDYVGTGSLVMDGGTLESSTGVSTSASVGFYSGTNAIGGSNNLTLSGTVAVSAVTLTDSDSANVTISGGIQGSGLISQTAGTLVLSGNNSSYSGNVTVGSGILFVGSNTALGTGSLGLNASELESSANVTLSNNVNTSGNVTLGGSNGLDLTGTFTMGSGTSLLVNNSASTIILGGVLSGAHPLIENGSGGSLLLSGTNTYSGGTTLDAGNLIVGNNNALGTGGLDLNGGTLSSNAARTLTNAITMTSSSTIGGSSNLTLNGAATLSSGTLLDTDTGTLTLGGVVSGAGSLAVSATGGTLVLGNSNTYSGATSLQAGTLSIGSASNIGSGNLVFSGGTLKTTTTGITLSNTITGSSSFNITTGTLNLTGNLGGLTGMAVQNGILNLNLPSNQSFAFNITGTGSLETSGTHTLTLSGTNSYSGATYLNGGILSIGSSTNIGSGNINFGGGTLQTTSTTTLSNNMSGAGVINAGSNSLTLTGDISSMTSLNIASGHLDLDPSANETLNFGISGAGSLSLDGSSVVTLSGPGSNTYSGGTALNGVTVVMTNTDVLGTGTVTLNGGNLEASLPLAVSPNFVLGADSTLGGTSGINFFGNFNLGGHILTVTEVGETELLQGVISGSGSLVENASGGTLFLFSNDSYTGGTTITAGTLQTGISNALPTGTALEDDGTLDLDGNSQQVGSLTGTGSVTNTGATEGNLTVNNSSADSFAGNMAGDMQLTKSGAGTLTLTGDISSITSLDIAAGNLALDPSAAQTLSFNITGGGSLSLDGSQVFTLGGTNTYSGGSALNGVTVVLAHNNVLGSGTVTLNGGMLESSLPVTLSPNFTLGADATLGGTNAMSLSGNFNLGAHTLTDTDTGTVNLGGVISGSGSLLENAVGGTLNLSGANSYTGASTVTAGTLQLGASNTLPTGTSLEDDATVNLNGNSQQVGSLTGTGAVTNTSATAGTLTINNSSADSFAGDLTGNLGLTKTGAGTLTLAGVNSYTGLTTVNGGTLVASGINLPGGANVGGSGTLQATGSFGGTITNNGLLYTTTSPGTPGALSGGSFTQGSSGALVVDASPTSASLLTVTGAASLNGSLYLNQDLGNWGLRYRYVIVSAGSITGSFTTTIPNLYQGFTDTLAYGSNAVTLTLIRTNADFTANAQGSNQTAVGKVLNGLIATGSDAILNDLNQIYALSVADQKTALAGLTGQVYTALPTVLLGNLQTEDGLLFARLDGGAQLTPNPAAAAAMGGLFSADVNQMGQAGNAAPLAQVQSQGFWLQNTDNFGSISGNANVTAFNQSDAGFLGGYDAQLMPGLTGGLMGGYVHTTVTAQDGTGQTGVDGYQFGVYGKQSLSDIELEMVAGYGLDHFKTNRTISLGSGSNAVQGTTDGSQMEAALQGDYRMEMDGIIVMPLAGVEYAHFNENAFTETGAGGLSLSLAGQSYDSLRPYVGVNGAKTYALGGDMKLTPMVNLSLSEELAENAGQFQAAFTGASTNSFTVTGVAPSGTLFGLGLGVNLALGKPLNLFASYNGHFSGTESLNGFSGGLSLSF